MDPRLTRAAAHSLLAHLLKLRAEGRASGDEALGWRIAG
ncbi:hypothetical protein ACFQU7_01480 [Pseudoroseomonas wenyumeiae]